MTSIDHRLPLPTLLSQALVAFTIEFDNEAEHQLPHRTTNDGGGVGSISRESPWLVSMAMWFNCMQFVTSDGVSVRELERLARTRTNLNGMQRWGYISVETLTTSESSKRGPAQQIIRPTPAGEKAQQIWRPLFAAIEKRWQGRFGKGEIDLLRDSLLALADRIDLDLPDCLPILGYGLWNEKPEGMRRERVSGLPLPALLAKTLLVFALEFESESEVSLAICANVLRLFSNNEATALRVRDFPRLSGVSKEAVAAILSFLTKRGYATVGADSAGSRTKVLMLTAKGERARDEYKRILAAAEERWHLRLGKENLQPLRAALEPIVGESNQKSPLFLGLDPHPENWRASIPRPEVLPHFPMVLHRGGYPDGS